MFSKTIFSTIAATVLSAGIIAPAPSSAGNGLVTINIGDDKELCIGLMSCLFTEAEDNGRDSDGVADHRGENVTDHRSGGSGQQGGNRDNTVVNAGPQTRDHRSTTTVRDHRTTPTTPTVRDHRTSAQNEVVPADQQKYECEVGTIILNRMGYNSIVAYDCAGENYHYTAMEGVSMFRAEMNAYTADMDVVFIGISQ